jgi:hypothetical protein
MKFTHLKFKLLLISITKSPARIAVALTFSYYALLFGISVFDAAHLFNDTFYFILLMPALLIAGKIEGCGFFFSGGCSNPIPRFLSFMILFGGVFLFFWIILKIIFLIGYLIIKLMLFAKDEYVRISKIPAPVSQKNDAIDTADSVRSIKSD